MAAIYFSHITDFPPWFSETPYEKRVEDTNPQTLSGLITFHNQRGFGDQTTGSENDFPTIIRNRTFDAESILPTHVEGFKSPSTFHFAPIQCPAEVINAFMGQNALKRTVFSLLDFSVLQPFGNANVQFWKTKYRLI